MNCEGRKAVPPFVWIGAAIMAVLVLALVGSGLWLAHVTHVREQVLCERSVRARGDNREMWEFLIADNADNPDASRYTAELNRRLPVLHCVDNHAVPLDEED
jgi:hypothetical protein